MKKEFNKILDEIKFSFGTLVTISNFLTAIVIFLSVYFVLSFFRFYPLIALLPALAFFFVETESMLKKRNRYYRQIEAQYPELNEKIRTAADNLDRESRMVEELQKEVAFGIRKVRMSSFVSTKKTSRKILATILLCFLILLISVTNIGVDIKPIFKDNYPFFVNLFAGNKSGDVHGESFSAGGGASEDILGDDSVAKLSSDKETFKLSPAGYELSITDIRAPEKREFKEAFPREIYGEGAETYEEQILTKEEYEIAKDYFLKITK